MLYHEKNTWENSDMLFGTLGFFRQLHCEDCGVVGRFRNSRAWFPYPHNLFLFWICSTVLNPVRAENRFVFRSVFVALLVPRRILLIVFLFLFVFLLSSLICD